MTSYLSAELRSLSGAIRLRFLAPLLLAASVGIVSTVVFGGIAVQDLIVLVFAWSPSALFVAGFLQYAILSRAGVVDAFRIHPHGASRLLGARVAFLTIIVFGLFAFLLLPTAVLIGWSFGHPTSHLMLRAGIGWLISALACIALGTALSFAVRSTHLAASLMLGLLGGWALLSTGLSSWQIMTARPRDSALGAVVALSPFHSAYSLLAGHWWTAGMQALVALSIAGAALLAVMLISDRPIRLGLKSSAMAVALVSLLAAATMALEPSQRAAPETQWGERPLGGLGFRVEIFDEEGQPLRSLRPGEPTAVQMILVVYPQSDAATLRAATVTIREAGRNLGNDEYLTIAPREHRVAITPPSAGSSEWTTSPIEVIIAAHPYYKNGPRSHGLQVVIEDGNDASVLHSSVPVTSNASPYPVIVAWLTVLLGTGLLYLERRARSSERSSPPPLKEP